MFSYIAILNLKAKILLDQCWSHVRNFWS